jgi:hypothetical protein
MDRCGIADAPVLEAWPRYHDLLPRLVLLALCDNNLTVVVCDLFVSSVRGAISVQLYGNTIPAVSLLELFAACSGQSALLRSSLSSVASSSSSSSVLQHSSSLDEDPVLRRSTSPLRALVPRPATSPSINKIASKYGIKTIESESSAQQLAAITALQEDKNVLLGLYNKLLSEHAEVCLAYDEAVAKCKGVGLNFPDLGTVKGRALK